MKIWSALALDVGRVKVGVAMARTGSTTALPIGSFERRSSIAEKEILALLAGEKPDIVIAGLPLNEDGAETAECGAVRAFCRRIERRAGVTIHFIDEYGSTFEARQKLGHLKAKDAKEKGALDAVSASIILQRYLDGQARQGE